MTWTNRDATPHPATAEVGSFDSGGLDNGDSFSQTFDRPGTYDVYPFQANMKGAVVVT